MFFEEKKNQYKVIFKTRRTGIFECKKLIKVNKNQSIKKIVLKLKI